MHLIPLASNKVLLITNIPTPYRIPLFNEFSRQLSEEGMLLKVVFGATGYDRRKWKMDMADCLFDYEVLPSIKIYAEDTEGTAFTYPGLFSLINRERPCVLITSGFSVASTKLWIKSWFRKTPYIIWSGAVERRERPDHFLRKLQRRLLVKRALGFIAYGTMAKQYLFGLGAPIARISIGINTVDTDFFAQKVKEIRRGQTRAREKKHLLYVGHLTARKNVQKILKVFKSLCDVHDDIFLDIVGDGEDRISLQQYVRDNALGDHVYFHGFRQKEEIPQFFAKADCVLFQTDFDIWGLVLVEAMAAGIPCISSIYAGATHDLIEEGVTGFKADFNNIAEVTGRISQILDDKSLSDRIGMNASNFIKEHATIKISAKGFVTAIQQTLSVSSKKGGF